MISSQWQKGCFLLAAALGLFVEKENLAAMNYESYLESWDPNWQNVVQNLPPGPGGTSATSYQGVTLNIGFACYDFSMAPTPGGLQFPSPTNLSTVVNFVHSHGGKARLSFGGASHAPPCAPNYFISQTAGWPGNAATLASGVVSVITGNNLDGVDFDLEDTQPAYATPQQFANDLITFIRYVRDGLPAGKTISITIPAQGWNTYWFYLATGVAAMPGLVDYISFMEYDIWVNGSITYPQQILADITTYTSSPTTSPPPNYSPGWGISPSLVQLGLMPGCDDLMHFLSVTDAQGLTREAVDERLYGVMTWDLNRDSGSIHTPACSTFPTGYEYSNAIRQILGAVTRATSQDYSLYPEKKGPITLQSFSRQSPPSHGSP